MRSFFGKIVQAVREIVVTMSDRTNELDSLSVNRTGQPEILMLSPTVSGGKCIRTAESDSQFANQ